MLKLFQKKIFTLFSILKVEIKSNPWTASRITRCTKIEINASPYRLDLDWRLCKFAKEQKVPICINPDAHDTNGLNDVWYGVQIARKGWLERSDILNTKSGTEIESLFNN